MCFLAPSQWSIPLLLLLSVHLSASACEYTTMRDAGFDNKRDMHRLCVMGAQGDEKAEAIYESLKTWRLAHPDINVEVRFVDVDDAAVDWPGEYGVPSAPPVTPVTALIGRRTFERKSWVIDHWEPEPTEYDLRALAGSPAREAIREHVGAHLAVLLYSPGKAPGVESHAAAVDEIVRHWQALSEEWFGVKVVTLDRYDVAERTICRFAGITPEGPDWLGVVFGRGKLMAPAFEGQQINLPNVNDLLDTLTGECTCLQNASSLGVDLPLIWTDEDQSRFRPHKQPPATQPTVATAQPVTEELSITVDNSIVLAVVGTFVGLVALVGVVTFGLLIRKRPQ